MPAGNTKFRFRSHDGRLVRLDISTLGSVLVLLATVSGCAQFRTMLTPPPPAPVVFQGLPTSDQLMATIAFNSRAVQQLECDVKVTMDGLPTGASGTLLVERPDRLRLKVGVLGMTDSGIDIGNNEELFWVFNKSSFGGQTPAIYFARHAEFRDSAMQQSLQLQPQWLIDALGLLELDSTVRLEGPFQRHDGFLELRAMTATSGGEMNRVLVIDPRHGWILQQAIYDPGQRLVAWSKSTRFRYYPDHQASLPGHVELNLVSPDRQTTRLAVTLHSHNINRLYVDPAVTWQMPQPADVPRIDLSTVNPAELNPSLSGTAGQPGEEAAVAAPRPPQLGQLRGFNLR